MKIGVYAPSNNEEHIKVLKAFAQGVIKASGHVNTVKLLPVDEYFDCDVAVVFGIGKKNVPVSYARGEIIRRHQERGLPVLVLEKGYVRRDAYYAAGWNGLNNRANFCNNGMPSDRWDALDIELKPWRRDGRTILVCCQVPSDASVQNVDIIDWCARVIRELRSIAPDREIIFRPHPLARDRTPDMLHAHTSTRPLNEDLDDALFVVTYNSNIGVDAVINGIPIFVGDKGAMAYDVASKNLSEAYLPGVKVIKQWAYNLAYTQWTIEEMARGLPWQHLTTAVELRTAG